jgi:thiosulfate dehydrogenase [quinone] large subunit
MKRRAPLPGVSTPNVALAGLEMLVGYEWLVSGVDKVLLGTFPDAMPRLLNGALSGGRIPGFFAALLQALVLPNAQLFGVLVEGGETLAGLGLLAVGLVTLLRPLAERYLKLRTALVFSYGARLLDLLAPFAAAGAGLLGLSFFLLDGLPLPWFAPGIAFGGAIDTGLFLAVASVILIVARLRQQRQSQRG